MLKKECIAIIQNELLPKLKDYGCFSIPCVIGTMHFEKALCDLGENASLMPLSVYEKLGLSGIKPTRISLQLADRPIKYPIGIAEDVKIRIWQLIIPTNFIIMDIWDEIEIQSYKGDPSLPQSERL